VTAEDSEIAIAVAQKDIGAHAISANHNVRIAVAVHIPDCDRVGAGEVVGGIVHLRLEGPVSIPDKDARLIRLGVEHEVRNPIVVEIDGNIRKGTADPLLTGQGDKGGWPVISGAAPMTALPVESLKLTRPVGALGE